VRAILKREYRAAQPARVGQQQGVRENFRPRTHYLRCGNLTIVQTEDLCWFVVGMQTGADTLTLAANFKRQFTAISPLRRTGVHRHRGGLSFRNSLQCVNNVRPFGCKLFGILEVLQLASAAAVPRVMHALRFHPQGRRLFKAAPAAPGKVSVWFIGNNALVPRRGTRHKNYERAVPANTVAARRDGVN
jgi:hypothetical protein